MILTVTLNLALDVTYHVESVRLGATTAVDSVARQAGGKGVNVARVLHALGREVAVTGFAGGVTGAAARNELTASGLRDQTVPVAGDSRTALIIVDSDGQATGFSEPGPEVSSDEWQRMLARFGALIGSSDAVVVSGSLPPGVPVDAYAQLISIAASRAVPALLDAHGEALVRGVDARPDIIKINAGELASVVDRPDVLAGARLLRELGAGAVVITDGADGLIGVSEHGAWQAKPPGPLRGNPTGAGDAASAALIAGLVDGAAWPDLVADATALSAAAVCAPLAGAYDDSVYRRLQGEIVASVVGMGD